MRAHSRRRVLRWAGGTLLTVAAAAAGLYIWAGEAAAILYAIQQGPRAESGPVDLLPPENRETVMLSGGPGVIGADLYLPPGGDRPDAAVVLVHGADRAGRAHPDIAHFAQTLARARFAVLVPEFESIRTFQLSAADAEPIARAVRYMAGRAEALGYRNVGVAAISYAVGPAVLAALEPEMRPRIGFVLGIGGYYDVVSALTYSSTGWHRAGPGEEWRFRAPNAFGTWMLVYANAGLLERERDRIALWALAARKMRDPHDDVSTLVDELGPDGRAVYALAVNDDPERVPDLIAALPEPVRERIAGLDLSRRDLGALEARLILVHGRADPMIPHTESRKLAAAAPDAALYVVSGMGHVRLDPDLLEDGVTLVRAVNAVLAERGRVLPALADLPAPG